MPSVRIPTPLRRLTGEKDEVAVTASNISDLIEELESQYPGIKERLCDEDGSLYAVLLTRKLLDSLSFDQERRSWVKCSDNDLVEFARKIVS